MLQLSQGCCSCPQAVLGEQECSGITEVADVQVKGSNFQEQSRKLLLNHNLPYGFVTFITSNVLLYHLVSNVESEQYFVFSVGQMLRKVSD